MNIVDELLYFSSRHLHILFTSNLLISFSYLSLKPLKGAGRVLMLLLKHQTKMLGMDDVIVVNHPRMHFLVIYCVEILTKCVNL